MPGTTKLPPLN